MVSAEKCLQLKIRETGQRGGTGPVDILSGASQCDMPGSWLRKNPFHEDVAIHQTLHFSIDPGWLYSAPRATCGLWEEGTQNNNKVGWTEVGRATQESLLLRDLLAKAHPSFPLDFQGQDAAILLSCPASVGLAKNQGL